MTKLVDANLIDGQPVVFARNKLIIVTKPGNPKNVKTLADLATVGVVSLCGDNVPCGKYAAQILQTAGVTIPESSITRGIDVKATLAAVTQGDADAAIVYVTDAKTAGSQVATRHDPRRPERDRHLPDRDARREHEQGDVAGLHRLGDLAEGSGDAAVVRVPAAVVSRRGRRGAVAPGAPRPRRVRLPRAAARRAGPAGPVGRPLDRSHAPPRRPPRSASR